MRFEKKKLAKLIDEIASYCLSKGACSLTIDLKTEEDRHLIHVEAKGVSISARELKQVQEHISSHREVEMEEYYWSLVGDSVTQDELTLVASMTDVANATLEGDLLKIELMRLIK